MRIMVGNTNLEEDHKKSLITLQLNYFLKPPSKFVLPNT